jgi:cysteine synthase A
VRQFENPANPAVHRRTTALEILEQVPELDAFVAGVGTGGTVTGVGEVLAQKKPGTLVVAVEPETSPLLSAGQVGPNKIQGIGPNFVPAILNREAFQRVRPVSYDDAIAISRRLAREEGLLTGISTGAIVFAALEIAKELGEGKTVVAVLCDTGERYLSHPLFAEIDAPSI